MLFDKIKLEADEHVLKTVRKHWFIITIELIGIGFMLCLPFILIAVLHSFENFFYMVSTDTSGQMTLAVTFGIGAWTLLSLFVGFSIWTHYYLDLWIITDRRIILVDQIHFFNRNVSIFRLERMQDIEYKISGIIPTLLNFGTLKAQTAGAHESNFTSNGLPDPRALQATIQSAMDKRMSTLHIQPDEVAMHH